MISFFQSTKYITIFQLFKMTKMSFSVFELFFKIVAPILEKRTYLVSCTPQRSPDSRIPRAKRDLGEYWGVTQIRRLKEVKVHNLKTLTFGYIFI